MSCDSCSATGEVDDDQDPSTPCTACIGPSGRYWRLYQLEPTNGGSLGYSWHITELRLFDSSGQSLAIAACDSQYLRSGNGGTGWRDGTLGGAYDCRNAYDGVSSSYSPRQENQIEGGMMAVDLGATYTVSTVEMTSLQRSTRHWHGNCKAPMTVKHGSTSVT